MIHLWKRFPRPFQQTVIWTFRAGGLLFLLILLIVLLFPKATLGWLVNTWEVEHSLVSADAIFIPGGGGHFRPQHAAALWHDGFAPTLLVSRPEEPPNLREAGKASEQEIEIETLLRHQVPRSSIIALPTEVSSTVEEIDVLRQWIIDHDVRLVIIATDRFHSRRFYWLASRRIETEIGCRCLISISPWRHHEKTTWWRNRWGRSMFIQECLKMTYSLVFQRG
ncbi:MAG: YdcF family protein [Verrucomicrobiota bacterium]